MIEIRLYDTLSRHKQALVPADPKRVTMYVCGPTVYNRAHIGNARPAVVFDVLFRLLRHTYGAESVVYARNFTDIDDKIMAAAVKEGVPIETITRRYEDFYTADMAALGVLEPSLTPRATENVVAMIAMIATLVAKGAAYAAEGHVLFDITSDAEYGSLSRRPMDEMIAGARVEVAPYKKNPGDFVLWKPSSAEQPGWESPWGRGRPGWHIECSAMIEAHLGTTIDIHGGGLDLQFPHHENECAQSRCAHGAPLANIWMHNGFLSMDREKMSKSLGNVVTVEALLAQGHRGEVLRLALLMAHYRQPLDWNERLIEQAKSLLDKWYEVKRYMLELQGGLHEEDRAVQQPIVDALCDDLNTPKAISEISKLVSQAFSRRQNGDVDQAARLSRKAIFSANFLGLALLRSEDWRRSRIVVTPADAISSSIMDSPFPNQRSANFSLDQAIEAAITARAAAKKAKNWAEADRIRDELKAEGIILEDRPDGTTDWRRG